MNGLLHVDDLTPEEIFEEVASLLARGYRRCSGANAGKARPDDGCPGESLLLPEKRLDFQATEAPMATRVNAVLDGNGNGGFR